ncbi:hypothetical protein [Shewanella aestuarii]|uniref:Uncharacterized protein n=1 Tax=Shewanella aestuarii TaxID=1028752 RepID=A0A6G9QRA1_9GAMM|nr:hypothetical protein [Shewanella aestuarii]QIR16339.1 hypothetical protein HBH39_17795 [Shewanella aestuarii]
MQVQGIYDVDSRILTVGMDKAFRVSETLDTLDVEARLQKLTEWARANSYIGKDSIIAEI